MHTWGYPLIPPLLSLAGGMTIYGPMAARARPARDFYSVLSKSVSFERRFPEIRKVFRKSVNLS